MAGTVPWVIVTINDLYARLNVPQADAIRADVTQDTSRVDPFTTVMQDVAAEIRQAIASNPNNQLSATAHAVPPELRGTATWLIVGELGTRLSATLPLTEDQRNRVERAKERLEAIKRMDQPWSVVSAPADPEASGSYQYVGPLATVVDAATDNPARQCTRETLHAL